MSDQCPRLIPFFLSIPISLPPLLLHSLLLFYFPPLSTFPFFLSSLIRPFFTILLHFLVASYFVLPLLSACPSLHSFLYSLSPLFTQFHSSPILGTCYRILVPLLSIVYLSSQLFWLRFISIYVLFIYSQSCPIIRTFPPIHAGTELFRLCCPILILPTIRVC